MSDLQKLENSVRSVARAVMADVIGGPDATCGHVECLTEAVMGITSALSSIADAIEHLAEAVENQDTASVSVKHSAKT